MEGWTAEDLAAVYKRLREPVPDLTKDDPADYQAQLKESWPTGKPEKPAPKPRKPSRKLEEQIQRQIIDLLEAHGWLVMRTNKFCGQVVATQGAIEPGMPDLMARKACGLAAKARGIYAELAEAGIGPEITGVRYFSDNWRIIWIEVKRPGGKVSVAQATWHQLAQRRGETVLVAESVEQVAAAIGVTL